MGTLTSLIMSTVDGFYKGTYAEFHFWTEAGDEFDTFSTEYSTMPTRSCWAGPPLSAWT
jgi:hypothetical protein